MHGNGRTAAARAAGLLFALALGACSDESKPPVDSDSGAGLDAGSGSEAGTDDGSTADAGSELDAGNDAGSELDAQSDGGPESDADSVPDASAGSDAGADAGADAGNGLWQDCPTSADYIGPASGPHQVIATDEALYCAMFDETRTLKEELAAKAMLRFAPGSYPLQPQNRASFALPLCFRRAAAPHPKLGAPGPLDYSSSTFEGTTSHDYTSHQPVMVGSATLNLDARFALSQTGATVSPFMLDGHHPPLTDTGVSFNLLLCEDPQNCWPATIFDSCHFLGNQAHLHDVELTQGKIKLELSIGDSFASTEPGAFVRASGTFRGQSFDQRDYWKLIYNPEHHHFSRDFAVLFDAPIDGVCGLEITQLEPGGDDLAPDQAFAVDCELERLQTLTVTKHTHTRPPRP
jgi:hypothetical protein